MMTAKKLARLQRIIDMARAYVAKDPTGCHAEFCVESAEERLADGDAESARTWAMKSLRYSVGASSRVYQQMEAI